MPAPVWALVGAGSVVLLLGAFVFWFGVARDR